VETLETNIDNIENDTDYIELNRKNDLIIAILGNIELFIKIINNKVSNKININWLDDIKLLITELNEKNIDQFYLKTINENKKKFIIETKKIITTYIDNSDITNFLKIYENIIFLNKNDKDMENIINNELIKLHKIKVNVLEPIQEKLNQTKIEEYLDANDEILVFVISTLKTLEKNIKDIENNQHILTQLSTSTTATTTGATTTRFIIN
jgi:hypothetical protein